MQENTDPHVKGKFQERIWSALEYYQNNDAMMQFKLDLNKNKGEKLSVKAHSRRKKDAHEIDHAESEHAMAIQRSAYIAIDQDVSNKNLDQIANKLLFSKKGSGLAEMKESVFFKQRKWNVLDSQLE